MRRQSLETFAETRKQNNLGEGEGSGKRTQISGRDTLTFLQCKLTVDKEFRRRQIELQEQELPEKARLRELKEQNERERNAGNGAERNVERAMENMQQQMQQQDQILMQMLQEQQQQGQMMIAVK